MICLDHTLDLIFIIQTLLYNLYKLMLI